MGCSASCSQRWFGSRVAFLHTLTRSHSARRGSARPASAHRLRPLHVPCPGAAAAASGAARGPQDKGYTRDTPQQQPGVPQLPPRPRPSFPALSLSAQSARPWPGLAAPRPPPEGQRGTRLRPAVPEGATFPPPPLTAVGRAQAGGAGGRAARAVPRSGAGGGARRAWPDAGGAAGAVAGLRAAQDEGAGGGGGAGRGPPAPAARSLPRRRAQEGTQGHRQGRGGPRWGRREGGLGKTPCGGSPHGESWGRGRWGEGPWLGWRGLGLRGPDGEGG